MHLQRKKYGRHLSLHSGAVCEFFYSHRGRHRVDACTPAKLAGYLVNSANFDQTGSMAAITLFSLAVETSSIAVGANHSFVRFLATIVLPPSSLTLRAGFRLTPGKRLGIVLAFHTQSSPQVSHVSTYVLCFRPTQARLRRLESFPR